MKKTLWLMEMLDEDQEVCSPCPWCEATDFQWMIDGQNGWSVACYSCLASGPMQYDAANDNKAQADAINEWNLCAGEDDA